MAAKPKLTAEQRQRIADVAAARRAVPSDKELARELGVTVAAIRWNIAQLLEAAVPLRKLSKRIVSRGTCSDRLLRCQPRERSATPSASES